MSYPSSYQRTDNNDDHESAADGFGPAMSRILEQQRQDEVVQERPRSRVSYVVLGACLMVVYYAFFVRNSSPFQNIFHRPEGSLESVDMDQEEKEYLMSGTGYDFELEGKSKKKKKDSKKVGGSMCEDGGYSKRTLKRAYELPFASIFKDTKGEKKFEASSVIVVGSDAYAICDNSWAIARFGDELQPFQEHNKLIGDPKREDEDSGYEAIFHDGETFYVLRESVLHEATSSYHAIIEELALGDDDYSIVDTCSSEFEFEGDSKGFEGAISVHGANNELIVLGLCEGNHCSQTKKFDVGNGKLVAMVKNVDSASGGCLWSTVRMINIPSSAKFLDYSAITMDSKGRVAISSQENSQVWIGQMKGLLGDGLWDIDAMKFDDSVGKLYDFPKNDNCETIYCNVEGIHWINDEMLIAVSDKMKSKGKQDFQCFDKDQSVHVFVLP